MSVGLTFSKLYANRGRWSSFFLCVGIVVQTVGKGATLPANGEIAWAREAAFVLLEYCVAVG